MDLDLLQREVAGMLGVTEATVHNWEAQTHSVGVASWPAILEFLGYDPRPPGRTIGEKLKLHREARGLSAASLARQWGVDPATVTKYELKEDRLHNHLSIPRIAQFLGSDPLPPSESPGQYVRHVRYLAGLKQAEFAARLRVSNNTVSEWELDQKSPTPGQLDRIEAISMRLEKPLQVPCPESIRAECASTVRPDRRTAPRSAYPPKLQTLGDHIRKRRLDAGLSQAVLARQVGVDRNAVTRWEAGLDEPGLKHMPKIIEFLGYDLSSTIGTQAEQIRTKRRALGLSQAEFGELVGVSRETVNLWERGKREPQGGHLEAVKELGPRNAS